MPFHLPLDYLLGMSAWLALLGTSLLGMVAWRRRLGTRHRSRVKWANLALSVWVFFAAFTLVELYFAVIYDRTDAFNATNVSKHWFARHIEPFRRIVRFSDGYFTTYRDVKEFPKALEEGQHSLCFIGDSFTFGHGIADPADRFSDRIGADLQRKRPGRFVVSNLSDIGRDLQWTEMLLQEMTTDRYPLNTVVWVMCLNDVETFQEQQPDLRTEVDTSWLRSSVLVESTYFFNLAYIRVAQARIPRLKNYYSTLEEAYESPAWERMKVKFDEVRRLCVDAGIDLRVVIFPFVHVLGPDYPFRRAHQLIAEHCRAIGLPVLDLLPVLEPHAGETLTVNPLDPHPNERAHALAAEAIERDLLGDLVAE